MPSVEAEKYKQDFLKAIEKASKQISGATYKNDLELIKGINRAIDDMTNVREKHVRQ